MLEFKEIENLKPNKDLASTEFVLLYKFGYGKNPNPF